MEWIRVKDQKPKDGDEVLVCTYVSEEDVFDQFFVACYWEREDSWMMHQHFKGGEYSPYIRTIIRVSPSDMWREFEWPEET